MPGDEFADRRGGSCTEDIADDACTGEEERLLKTDEEARV